MPELEFTPAGEVLIDGVPQQAAERRTRPRGWLLVRGAVTGNRALIRSSSLTTVADTGQVRELWSAGEECPAFKAAESLDEIAAQLIADGEV